jgi:hypothetical protein
MISKEVCDGLAFCTLTTNLALTSLGDLSDSEVEWVSFPLATVLKLQSELPENSRRLLSILKFVIHVIVGAQRRNFKILQGELRYAGYLKF